MRRRAFFRSCTAAALTAVASVYGLIPARPSVRRALLSTQALIDIHDYVSIARFEMCKTIADEIESKLLFGKASHRHG